MDGWAFQTAIDAGDDSNLDDVTNEYTSQDVLWGTFPRHLSCNLEYKILSVQEMLHRMKILLEANCKNELEELLIYGAVLGDIASTLQYETKDDQYSVINHN